eukprot:GHVQ01001440.1.p2 GENE.GHVQ01001440.1~~GHVQ01001440.1.p2  ORF type:complete len:146 (+),score=30.15 GHVQ01001440.1:31-438(+)
MCGLSWLVDNSQAGDVLVFTFAGCGTQLPDVYKPGQMEDALVPSDYDTMDEYGLPNIVYSDDIHHCLSQIHDGVQLLVVLDCSHGSDTIVPLHVYLDCTPQSTQLTQTHTHTHTHTAHHNTTVTTTRPNRGCLDR